MHPRFGPVAAAALVAFAVPASAQGVGLGAGQPFHAMVLATGMSTMSVDALNARMATSQFAPLSNDAVLVGASGYVAIGRALLGGELSRSVFGEEGLNNGRTDELSATHAQATIAYALLSTRRLSLFPQVGAGVGRIEVTLRDRAGTGTATAQPTFDEVAQAPGSESRLSGRHLLYSVGGGADYLVSPAGSRVGVVLGVRAGLLVAPNRTTWTRAGERIVAGPDASPGGAYARLVVGVGGR